MKRIVCLVLAFLLLMIPAMNVFAKEEVKEEKEIKVRSVEISSDTATIRVDQERALWAYALPYNAQDKTIRWESSNNEVAIVGDESVIGISPGEAIITATSADGKKSAQCVVTVVDTIASYIVNDFDIKDHPHAMLKSGERLYAATLRADAQALLAKKNSSGVLSYQNKTKVSAAALRGADYAARLYEKKLSLNFETTQDKAVVASILIDTANLRSATKDINPKIYINSDLTATQRQEAQKLLGQKVNAVYCAQAGTYGAEAEIAVKLDGISSTDSVKLYQYKDGALTLMEKANPRADSNGFVHFNTSEGGIYIIA